jgi:transketolase
MKNYLIKNWNKENKLEMKSIREGFGDAIEFIGDINKDIVVINADLPDSLKVKKFAQKHPNQYVQVGVAEQNMAGIGHGLAEYGKTPFITSFAAFSPGLNYSQIRLAAMSNANMKIVSSHYGLNVGADGASAQMNEDIGIMKSIPGMVIINPADYVQAIQATKAISETKKTSYLRVTREKFPVFFDVNSEFEIGKAQKLLEGKDATIISTGSMVYESLMAVNDLSVDFLNIHTVKPLDQNAILESAKKTGKVIVIEEHNVIGGLGEMVASLLGQNLPTPIKLIGLRDSFGESGSHIELWKKYQLDRDSIRKEVIDFIK